MGRGLGILTKKYIKTGTTPVFTGELEKLRGHWDAFVEYKSSSELGLQKVQKAKDNASKKVYHHTLGQGGYKLAEIGRASCRERVLFAV